MIVYEPMLPIDILGLDTTNLDLMSENFTFGYYMGYLLTHPYDFFTVRHFKPALLPTTAIMGNPVLAYAFGKRESKEKLCYHLSAISVAPCLRASGVGSELMRHFEATGNSHEACFIDLYVRMSNTGAIAFYKRLGYVTYRTVFNYYWYPNDHALDMRLSLKNDMERRLMVPGKDIDAAELAD